MEENPDSAIVGQFFTVPMAARFIMARVKTDKLFLDMSTLCHIEAKNATLC